VLVPRGLGAVVSSGRVRWTAPGRGRKRGSGSSGRRLADPIPGIRTGPEFLPLWIPQDFWFGDVAGEGFVGLNFGGPLQWPDDSGTVEALRVEVFYDDVRAGGVVWAGSRALRDRQWGQSRRSSSRRLCSSS
jgi:hypothetical protein